MNTSALYKSRAVMMDNVEQVLRDAFGNIKPLFTENALGLYLLRFFRKHVPNPIDANGQVKPGLKNYLAAYGLRIPFITGRWSNSRKLSNLITNAGRSIISGLINGSGTPAAFTYIAVGTSTTAASTSDTALGAETTTSGLARAAGTVSKVTTTITNDTAEVSNTFSVTGSVAVTESGLFNASSGATILAHQVFSAINVNSGDTLQIIWKIQNA